jgi:putative transposase
LAHSPSHPATEAEYHKEFAWRLERWLDRGTGSCLLRESSARAILADVLMKFQGERYEHHAWVIMPNHVHLLFVPHTPLEKLIQAWKSKSANRIGKGSIWQRNYRDTLIRDADHFANAVRYMRNNPVKAKLPEGTITLWQSPRAQRV